MTQGTKRTDEQAAMARETRLSDAILRLTELAGSDAPAIVRALTVEARSVADADCGLFFSVATDSSRATSFGATIIDGAPLPESDRILEHLFTPTSKNDLVVAMTGQSWLVLPMVTPSDTFLGHLAVGKAGANQFGSGDERRLAALIAHASQALDRAKLAAAEIGTRRNLGRALAIRENFLSVASHELRNPLNSLHLRLDILKREAGLVAAPHDQIERLRAHVEKAGAQVSRMARLLDRLLDISRMASGRIQLEPRRYDIAAQIEQVAERFADQAAPGQIRVTAPGPVIGSWDELRADQVLTNLLSNSIKYGEGKPIDLTLRTSGDFVEITISDHGIGIAIEDQDRVFERFERVESDRSRSGFGLGLWISRQIVMAMGGIITVKSEPGQGATFTVHLPRVSPMAK
jgi:signal transduction histidine kinase